MALYKRGGVWWISLYHNGKRHRISTKTSDRKKAEEIYAKVMLKLNNSKSEPAPDLLKPAESTESSISYAEFYEKHYLPWCYKRQAYYESMKKYYLNVLPEWFKELKLKQIGLKDVEYLQSYFIEKKYSIATCNRYISILKASFSKACDWNMITERRLKEIRKVQSLKGETKRLRYLTKEEINRLLFHCEQHLYPIIYTAIHTGMRKGEILALKWSQIDLKNGIILLDRTKNYNRREVAMTDSLKALFRQLHSQRRLDTDYVFVNPDTGKRYTDLKRSFNSACRKAGIRDFHFHDLRHTFASHLVMSGADLKTVQELLGHKSLTMTLRYSHLSQAHKKEALKALENNFGHSPLLDSSLSNKKK
ncbi:site-specific integrase [Thermodesulfovibrio sp. 1176]|uniref:tyrosine-type recombinase/integrase n=1 Tax=Thermodesulfovibrio sp. 1176 TaxID=3043424 RepID=UPI002482DE5B|nr:site-specific integrase [Thermodesulfovibrio sp. 1176]MDI1472115.1 site-specific integrase [Thermodesulfovibrio sp. 1176]